MKRAVIIGAAAALLSAGVAFAQQDPNAGQGPVPMPDQPTMDMNAPPPPPPGDRGPDQGDQGPGGGWHKHHGWGGPGNWRDGWGGPDHGPGAFGPRGPHGMHGWGGPGHGPGHGGPKGAVFRLSRGDGGPSIFIKCADGDTTKECVDAITPMLNQALHNPPAPATK